MPKVKVSRRRESEQLASALGFSAGALGVAELAQASDAEPSRTLNTLVMPDAYEQVSDDKVLLRLHTGEQLSLISGQFAILDGGLLLVVDELAQEAISQMPVMGAVRTQLLTEVQPVRSADGSIVEATDAKPLWSGGGDTPWLFEQVDIERYELTQNNGDQEGSGSSSNGSGIANAGLSVGFGFGFMGLINGFFGNGRLGEIPSGQTPSVETDPEQPIVDEPTAQLLLDIREGPESTFSGHHFSAATINDLLVFTADDGMTGLELWVTDGTSAGTMQILDLYDGYGEPFTATGNGAWEANLTEFNGKLFFVGNDGEHGSELWYTDGTTEGTAMLADLNDGSASGTEGSPLFELNGYLYFTGTDGNSDYGLWRTDGTVQGLELIKSSLTVRFPIFYDGEVFFSGNDGSRGNELYKTDGSSNGTVIVKDIELGLNNGDPLFFHVNNDKLFFTSFGGTMGGLWVTDGTEANTVQLRAGQGSGEKAGSSAGLFFAIGDENADDVELWKTDGTLPGTELLKDINLGPSSSHPSLMTSFNDKVFFAADNGSDGFELWSTDGTEVGTALVLDINEGSSSSLDYIHFLEPLGEHLYFNATDGRSGWELWRTDGTPTGTERITDINADSGDSTKDLSIFGGIYELDDSLIFAANDGQVGTELWLYG